MRCRELFLGMTVALGLLCAAGDARAHGCATCVPAPAHFGHGLHGLRAHHENWKGCADCNPHDPYYCGSTGANGSNGYCNQRLQAVRRIGVMMNKNTFMGDAWLHRYNGGYNFTPPSPYLRPAVGPTSGH